MSKLSSNIFYSSFLAIANYIFPLLVFPYISRVLGVTNIGICNFIDSIIHYFILFSMMGITIIGTREISSHRNNIPELEKRFSSLLVLNGSTTIIALIALCICTFSIGELRTHKWMMLYGSIKLISNFFLIEWFYRGMEQFRFITIRTIIVKCLFVISVYIFVTKESDFITYYLLSVLMVTGNAVINILYSSKLVKFKIKSISLSLILRPFFILGIYMLVTSMCTTFNIAYLGFATNNTQVGYYTTATKLYTILLALFTGATTAIMPHMSKLIASGKHDEFTDLLLKASNILFSFSIPLIILSICYAPQIVLLISGQGYEGAIIPMQIVMPLMLIIGYEQIVVIQGLMPLSKDQAIMRNAIVGACISLSLNLCLVSTLQSIGSAITWLCSELAILILSQFSINKSANISFPWNDFCRQLFGHIPLLAILIITTYFLKETSYWINLLIAGMLTMIYVGFIQIYVFKNPLIISHLMFLKAFKPK